MKCPICFEQCRKLHSILVGGFMVKCCSKCKRGVKAAQRYDAKKASKGK